MYCANIIDGEIFLGNNYMSGEIGHSIANVNGRRCECGKYGCLQTISSEQWLLNVEHLLHDVDNNTILKTLAQNKDDITLSILHMLIRGTPSKDKMTKLDEIYDKPLL